MTELLQALAIVLVGYGTMCLYAVIMAERLIFPAPPSSYSEDAVRLRVPADDGSEIAALWLPCEEPKATLLYCHGNAEDLGDIRPVIERYVARGYAVLAVEYPGYGQTEGSPSEEGCCLAADAGWDYLRESLGIPASEIIVYGRSLGGGPATDLASRQPVGGLVLDGTFTSCFRVQTRVKVLPWDVFDSLGKIPETRCPLLSLHGAVDRIISWKHAHQLYGAAPGKRMRLWCLTAGHNDLMDKAGEEYWRTLDAFAELVKTEAKADLEKGPVAVAS
ncbi:MAG: alpha/beta hydrolase [Opitutales bacterium]